MKTIFSGIQPSGVLHIGNYLGALKQWVELQENNMAYFCIVDLHAITVPYDTELVPEHILNAAAAYLAAGVDPEKSTIFVQSRVPAHTELAWLLSTQTPFGDLVRMTQFKEKSAQQKNGETLGLFAYPVLQAADILLYQADLVPVGKDQVQHIELTRDIAKRFNNRFGEVFTIPAARLHTQTARIMSLTDPKKKMSKSGEPKSYIALTDTRDSIRQKIMGAVTETEPVFSFTESGPAVHNLLSIYQALSGEASAAIEKKFSGAGYKAFKETLADLIIATLEPIQQRYAAYRQPDKLRKILASGAERVTVTANNTLESVKQAMGLTV
ncbi:MAG: tryptophan--tRNA ligase [Candidatus Andersenbacteria bacterium CG10_big_fil_rev_8_21_14_0_10_54_11]|uniref:Tryptophan--tRNA ligase n=1 Tax=Candidatus Andersenbacteria bacterium CG10_big_fil_rev_8_21_14_0_10_54_11 TaxID=1974485 RepID=A0A2M6X0B7_9BACT|nr:MAG: tryptophan--tRNA ligase [Candidatus Andersenbacteria bacterium CG10_big_fil_rev_8_21_14_0_10_54_11]